MQLGHSKCVVGTHCVGTHIYLYIGKYHLAMFKELNFFGQNVIGNFIYSIL